MTEEPTLPKTPDFPDLVGGIYNLHAANIRISPCHANRASSIGAPCLRQLIYSRIAWQKATKVAVETQLIFDEGNLQEREVLLDLTKAGFTVIEQQVAGMDDSTKISWHIDAIVLYKERRFPLEIKSCAPYIFEALQKYGPHEFRRAMEEIGSRYIWLKKYPAQVLTYCFGKGESDGLILFKNKSNGRLKQFVLSLNDNLQYLDGLFDKAKKINEVVAAFEAANFPDVETPAGAAFLPERINDLDECRFCSFAAICLPDVDFGKPLTIEQDPGFEATLERWFTVQELKKEMTDLEEVVNQRVYGRDNVLAGKFHITGKKSKSGAWLKKIVIIDDVDRKDIERRSDELRKFYAMKGGSNA
jgi:hypothetical protein